jgi:two-component system LytT family response regulator
LQRLVIHKGTRLLVVRLEEVDWIEGAGNYVEVHVRSECHLHRQTLTSLHARLDPRRFARIHRSAIVRLDAIAQLERGPGGGELELRDGVRLAVSRRYRRELLARLGAE